jgi:hypothetical protein
MNGKKRILLAAAALLLAVLTGCGLRTASGEPENAAANSEAAGTAETTGTAETEAKKSFEEILAAYAASSSGSAQDAASEEPAAASEAPAEPVSGESAPEENAVDASSVSLIQTDIAPAGEYKAVTASYSLYANGLTQDEKLFTERDLTQNADLTGAKALTAADNTVLTVTEEGVYVLSGTASEFTVKVNADKEAKVQIVLNNVSVTNASSPVIYVLSADKVFLTTAQGTENTLAVSGSFVSDSETGTKTDAVVYSKDDLVLNGLGTLNVISAYGNGITSKDDLKVTGGTWNIASALDALEANDSIAVCSGTFTISTNKDGLHCENDDALGFIWIGGGVWTVKAKSDGIQGTAYVQIDGGELTVSGSEGIEGTCVQINGGTIGITASDDGINASRKSTAYAVTVEINGGDLTVEVGQGDTDAIDANGSIYVNGGVVRITSTVSSFDYDEKAEFNGGTIIINGEEVDSIPQSMFGGPGGFGGWGGGQGGWGGGFGGGRGPGGRG